jgi:ABC-type multidrug transport system ATPase subunit
MIEVKGLSKSYGQTKAVDGVDLSIGKGELLAFWAQTDPEKRL